MPVGLEDGPYGPGTQTPGADVSEDGTTRLSGIICELNKNSIILF